MEALRQAERRSDRDLLAASRADGRGFSEFYRRHCEAVLSFHGARVRDPELAADLTSETFASALRAVHNLSRPLPDQPVAWLFVIARSRAIDFYRRGRADADALRRLAMERVTLDEDDIDEWLEAEHDDDRPLPDCFWYRTVEHSAPAYWV